MSRFAHRLRTLSMIRQWRAASPVPRGTPARRVGRIPRPLPPTRIEDAYFSVLRGICRLARECFNREAPEILHALELHQRAANAEPRADRAPAAGNFPEISVRLLQVRQDARARRRGGGKARKGGIGSRPPTEVGRTAQLAREAAAREAEEQERKAREAAARLAQASVQGKRAAQAVDRAADAFADAFRPDALHDVVLQFGKRIDVHSREQLDQQLRSAIGVPLSAIEKPYRDSLDEWAASNVDLIVTQSERYFDRLRLDILDAFEGATHPNTLAEQFVERYEMSERDAERIARDQVLSLNADLLQARTTDLGVEEYIWRTSNDGRVRDNHDALNGQRFRFDDPPMGGGTSEDEPGNPGDGILCRCYPEPVLDALLGTG